ncbi:unnamed protein product [Calypogeia fissa]
MPRHKKKKRAAAKPATSANKRDWFVGDLVVAKLRGHRPWPAQIQKPEDYGYDARPHRVFVTFFGTEETCFCSYNKITPFTSSVRKNLAEQLQKINTNPELERAIKEIFAADDELRTSSKSLGSNQKEDDEIASEKSEEEEPPVERSRKRARVVEEAAASVSAVDERPAKQEKTVKSMAAEQVQKLPRKVRIKVSTQGSDLPTPQQGALPGSVKAGVSSSQPSQIDCPPLRTLEPEDSAKTPVKNGDRTTTGKLDDSVKLKECENVVVEAGETISSHASENGGDAAEKTGEDHAATGSAAAKAEDDGVEKMEVDDDKSGVPKTSEPVDKGDDETSVVPKTSESAIGKEDDSSVVNQPATLETAEEGVEKMEVDDEKPVASKTNREPTTAKEDHSSVAKESGTAEHIVEKMEVDEEKSKISKPATEKKDESVTGDPAGKVVEASNVSTNSSQVNESSAAAKGQDCPTVEDMDNGRAGQEQVPPVAKEGVDEPSKSHDNQRDSGAKVDREDDGLEMKASSGVTQLDAIDEANYSGSKDEVPASKDEDVGKQEHGALAAQKTISATKDEAASRNDLQDGAVPGQSSRQSTDQAEKVPDCERQSSRLDQSGAVDRMEDQDGAVEKVEHQDDVVKKVEDHEGAVKETEEQDTVVKKLEDQETGAKKLEGHGVEVKVTKDDGAEVEKPKEQGAEVEKTEEKGTEVTKKEDKDVEGKKSEDQGAKVQATDEKDAALKIILGKDSSVKIAGGTPQLGSGESEVLTPASAKGDTLPQTVTEKTVDPTPVQQETDTPQIGTGNGEVSSTVQQEGETPQLRAADVVVVSTPAKHAAADEKRSDSSKEQPTTAS